MFRLIRRTLVLIVVFFVVASPAWAIEILQFGIIFPTGYRTGTTLSSGMGYGIESIVLANLGTAPINLSDVVLTSSVVSTTTPVSPLLGENVNTYSGLVLAPGQALGYLWRACFA